MKELLGGMLNGMKDVLAARAGEKSLKNILLYSGITEISSVDSPEAAPKSVLGMLEKLCRRLNIPLEETAEVYGEHWFKHYIPKITPYLGTDVNDSRSFLLKLNEIHSSVSTQDSTNQFFCYDWKDRDTLIMSFSGLDEWDNLPAYLFKGMISGVAKFYGEDVRLFTGPSNTFIIIFPDAEIRRRKILRAGSSN